MLKTAGVEYEVKGEGDAVLFIHAGFICDFDLPFMSQPALSKFRLIRYHRRGYGGSDAIPGDVSIASQAADAKALLNALGIRRAHVVGHSYGGAIALQLALDAPELVHSLVLSEPPLWLFFLPPPSPPSGRSAADPHDPVKVVDAFMANACGRDWKERAEAMVGGASAQADRDAHTHVLTSPALLAWKFDASTAARIDQPTLGVVGKLSPPLATQRRELLRGWVNQMEDFDVEGANHLLQLHNPDSASALAEGLAAFFRRHPIPSEP